MCSDDGPSDVREVFSRGVEARKVTDKGTENLGEEGGDPIIAVKLQIAGGNSKHKVPDDDRSTFFAKKLGRVPIAGFCDQACGIGKGEGKGKGESGSKTKEGNAHMRSCRR